MYGRFKELRVVVSFVSINDRLDFFQKFSWTFPFISTCDFKKWKSPAVQSYYAFGILTLFLLDKKREILIQPNSVEQMDAWVALYLIKENRCI